MTKVKIFKDAGDGKFVKKSYLKKHKKTTFSETVNRVRKSSKKRK